MILILKMEDGTTEDFGRGDFIGQLVRAVRDNKVETIIVGDVSKGRVRQVLWEKQFQSVVVVPSDFGKKGTK